MPDLKEHIFRTTARLLLNISGCAFRINNSVPFMCVGGLICNKCFEPHFYASDIIVILIHA